MVQFDDAYERLAAAIVKSAIEDYESACEFIHMMNWYMNYIVSNFSKNTEKLVTEISILVDRQDNEAASCQGFIYGSFFHMLTDANSDYVMKEVNKIVDAENKKFDELPIAMKAKEAEKQLKSLKRYIKAMKEEDEYERTADSDRFPEDTADDKPKVGKA